MRRRRDQSGPPHLTIDSPGRLGARRGAGGGWCLCGAPASWRPVGQGRCADGKRSGPIRARCVMRPDDGARGQSSRPAGGPSWPAAASMAAGQGELAPRARWPRAVGRNEDNYNGRSAEWAPGQMGRPTASPLRRPSFGAWRRRRVHVCARVCVSSLRARQASFARANKAQGRPLQRPANGGRAHARR
jgi:hypothetical protein